MLPGLEPKVVDAAPELFENAEACWLICRRCIVGFVHCPPWPAELTVPPYAQHDAVVVVSAQPKEKVG